MSSIDYNESECLIRGQPGTNGRLLEPLASTQKPNLFLIGAMKSGTTYLNKLLGAHPLIFMCTPEEPTYFVDAHQLKKLWPYMWDQGFWRSEERYLRLFRSGGEAQILGEASTNYTKLPMLRGVASRIWHFNKDARFIYLIRDPVERTVSHYWHMVHHHAENRQMIAAIKENPHYTEVSYYAMQLRPYFEVFSPDRIKVVTHERLVNAPAETMCELYEWLGVGAAAVDVSVLAQPENVTPKIIRMPTRGKLIFTSRHSTALRTVIPRLAGPVRRAVVNLMTQRIDRDSLDTSEVKKYLQPMQQRQTAELSNLLGRDFPEWRSLYEEVAG